MGFIDTYKAARRAAVPILGIRTADDEACIGTLRAQAFSKGEPALLMWDYVRGVQALNDEGRLALSQMTDKPETTVRDAALTMKLAMRLPDRACLFMLNVHRVINDTPVMQAARNLRDPFKANGRTLCLMGPAVPLPPELQGDVIMLDEPYPGEPELGEIVQQAYRDYHLPTPDERTVTQGVDAVLGLSRFRAEQTLFMNMAPEGLDLDGAWTQKRAMINETRGLEFYRSDASFQNIGGYANFKGFSLQLANGRNPFHAVAWIDELEKMTAANQTDSTGVQQDALMQLLTHMEGALAILLIGPPGSGKSTLSKAIGNMAGKPTIRMDLGGMRAMHVGESEMYLRQAFSVLKAVGRDRVLYCATCNSLAVLPPELRRRFKLGIWFCDLPDLVTQQDIWRIYLRRYFFDQVGPDADPLRSGEFILPEYTNWTGAEIERCCQTAWELDITLQDAAQYIVPVAVSAAEQIEDLRRSATGRYIDAQRPGVYTWRGAETELAGAGRRIYED